MQSEIIEVTRTTVQEIARLDEGCFAYADDCWDEQNFLTQLSEDGHHLFLAERCGGEIRGYICIMHVLDESEITRIGVFPRYRRQGIADALITAARERLSEMGIREMNLEVRCGNLPAQALYKKHGFVEVGCRKNYYQKENEDAILMKLIF